MKQFQDWPRLISLYESLNSKKTFKGISWKEMDSLLEGETVPPWFRGLGRAQQKLTQKHSLGAEFLASSELAEVASQQNVAKIRFSQLTPHLKGITWLNFPTCGAGLDAIHLLDEFANSKNLPVSLSDINSLCLDFSEYNLNKSHPNHSISYDICDFLEKPNPTKHPTEKGFCFLDPMRRGEVSPGQKYEAGPEPNLAMKLLEEFALAQIKLSPTNSSEDLISLFPDWKWSWTEVQSEVKELTGFWIRDSKKRSSTPKFSVSALHQDGAVQNFKSEHRQFLSPALKTPLETGMSVVLPRLVLSQSKISTAWAKQHNLSSIRNTLDLYSQKGPSKEIPLASSWILEKQFSARPKSLKRLISQAETLGIAEMRSWKCKLPHDLQEITHKILRPKNSPLKKIMLFTAMDRSLQCFILRPSSST